MFFDELQQFVMVSTEVWQDLHWRYSRWLWPWWLVFILCNGLVLAKSKQALFFTYVAFCWIFLGFVYFMRYVQEVHTFAIAVGTVFMFQGGALFYLKVLRPQSAVEQNTLIIRQLALVFYGVTALIPLSYAMAKSKESILLFGWGPEQTALGTVALVIYSLRNKVELLLVCVPLLWIFAYILVL